MTPVPPENQSSAPHLRWIAPSILALAAGLLLWATADILLIILFSIVIAIGLTGLAKPISAYLNVPHVVGVLAATLIVIIVIGWPLSHFGSRLWAQFDEIARDIPAAVLSIKESLESHQSIRFLEDIFAGFDFSKVAAPAAMQLSYLVTGLATVMSYMIVLLFGGVYLAIDPDRYINGLIYFSPPKYRTEVRHFLSRSGSTLRTWLFTQLLVVLMNGLFAGIGLWAFGVDGAAALAMLAGALSFIPYAGTILAMVIGALAALPQGANFAVYTLIVLGATSFFEGYLVTPYIQSRTLSLPPVILIFAIFAFTLLFGILGLILAAPLTVIVMVALDTFYKPAP